MRLHECKHEITERGCMVDAGIEKVCIPPDSHISEAVRVSPRVIQHVQEDKLAVLVGTITDDKRLYELPKLRVVALRFTETARARILKVNTMQSRYRLQLRTWCSVTQR